MRAVHKLIIVSTVLVSDVIATAQAVRPLPFDARLLTDPNVGNVEGIQRYGPQLKTDPDAGIGFSYQVRPVSHIGQTAGRSRVERSLDGRAQVTPSTFLEPPPFDATAGIRSFVPPSGPPQFIGADVERSLVFDPTDVVDFHGMIHHQPLIQIKVRVVEVVRDDTLKLGSVLDYVSSGISHGTEIMTNNVNFNLDRTTTATRFPQPRDYKPGTLINISNAATSLTDVRGSGALINVTEDHINYLTELLAIELGADVVTAPEVVTLNGQNVEFTSGSKQAFPLGQSVISGGTTSIQQVFYKHVGTYISVTPTIVNWGPHAEGKGDSAISATHVHDWSQLIQWMLRPAIGNVWDSSLRDKLKRFEQLRTSLVERKRVQFINDQDVVPTPPAVLVPEAIRIEILDELNKYPRRDLERLDIPVSTPVDCQEGCSWIPNECTIDLSVIVRLSEDPSLANDGSSLTLDLTPEPANQQVSTNEDNVRAIANVIQVKSGHGVVMAGLIGESDSEDIRKVPVLGDVPLVGYLFRSKVTNRKKTEVLIFIEARVLDSDPDAALARSYEDFRLGEPYVCGHFLDNPLEYGMYRAGFGTYLPPHSPHERVFWERLGRKVNKAATEIDDAFK